MRWGLIVSVGVVGAWLMLSPAPVAALSYVTVCQTDQCANGQPYRHITSMQDLASLSLDERQTLQPNFRYQALWVPNDPHYSLQWDLQQIQFPAAWDRDAVAPIRGGDPNITVAILDTGLAFEAYAGFQALPDVATNVWTNTGEAPNDGIDNDQNGYIDDVHGWNFVGSSGHPNDDNGHGTHIAGIIAAATDNGVATAGIAFATTVMPLKVLDSQGNGATATIASALAYAVANGADIINLSLGGEQDDPLLHAAIQQAVSQGIVIVGAAGNANLDTVTYPARYSEVVSVGANQYDGSRAPYSNYGSSLRLVAPGGNLLRDDNHDGQPDGIASQTCTDHSCSVFATFWYEGTSQAAAHVSAVVALLEACGVNGGAAVSLLEQTATDIGTAGRDTIYGYGRVNADAALAVAGCANPTTTPPSAITAVAAAAEPTLVLPGVPYPYQHPVFTWTGPAGAAYDATWTKNGQLVERRRQTATTWQPTVTADGLYRLTVTTVNAFGQQSSATSFQYRYRPVVFAASSGSTVHLLNTKFASYRHFTPVGYSSAKLLTVSAGVWSTNATARLFVASTSGADVRVFDTQGRLLRTLTPFGQQFRGTLQAVVLQNTRQQPLVVVSSPSTGAELRWYDVNGRAVGRDLLYATYRGGLDLAVADMNNDGNDELVVNQVHGPEVRLYDQQRQRLSVIAPLGKGYASGWQTTAADMDHDGRPELFLLQRLGTKRTVFVTTQRGVVKQRWTISGWPTTAELSWGSPDVNGDGVDELLVVPRRGPGIVQQWSLAGRRVRQTSISLSTINSFQAF
ncbi:MAG: S8 family serine peptidase [Candidatus Kerfeldbacteria bacterium]|nr:S8 family serine peptidase [Candidatus Kerfeldbacteria bacterium]